MASLNYIIITTPKHSEVCQPMCGHLYFVQAINPKLLIFVEGTSGNNFPLEKTANMGGYWWGGQSSTPETACTPTSNLTNSASGLLTCYRLNPPLLTGNL